MEYLIGNDILKARCDFLPYTKTVCLAPKSLHVYVLSQTCTAYKLKFCAAVCTC